MGVHRRITQAQPKLGAVLGHEGPEVFERFRHPSQQWDDRRIAVVTSVRYGGVPKEKSFSPASTVERVFEWATGPNGFNLTPAEKAKHVLALPGADHPLDSATHVGSLVSHEGCHVQMDLAPKSRFEG
jgi:hypothetical protein